MYQRDDRHGTIKPNFYMRIRVPLSASKGYFRGSTRESDKSRATQVALNKFDELYNKKKQKLNALFKDALKLELLKQCLNAKVLKLI